MADNIIEDPHIKTCWEDNITVKRNKKNIDFKKALDHDDQQQDNVYIELRHLLIYLSMLSCFHFKQWPHKVKKIWLLLSIGSSAFLLTSVWVFLIILLMKMQCASQELSVLFSSRIVELMLYLQTSINGTLMFGTFWRKDRFALLIQHWNTLSFGGLAIRKRIWLYCLPFNILTLSADCLIAVKSLKQLINEKEKTMRQRMCFISSNWMFYFITFYDILATSGAMSLFIAPCLNLTALSVKLVAEMDIIINAMKIDKENGALSNHSAIQKYRLMYEKWAKVVSHADLVFRWYYGFNLAFGVPTACSLGYTAYFDFQITNVYLALVYLFGIIAPCIPAAIIANNVSMILVLMFKGIEHLIPV